ncbi:MAG: HEPN domain-containing protein [Candidatus Rokuibacteriota bacterium]
MPDPDEVLDNVRAWVTKADNDVLTAAHTIKLGEDCPTDTACYRAQQCVEKFLKAILVLAGVGFPKSHDLERLSALVPPDARPRLSAEEQVTLTEYATEARYPGWDDIPLVEARRAVALARRVRKEVRRGLPRKSLVRRRSAPKR